MTKRAINQYDLLKDLSEQLRQRADTFGLDKYQPMPLQVKFHNTDTQGRLYSGGNRAGKTVGGTAEAVMWLTGTHPLFSERFPPPVRGRACAVDFDRGVNLVLIPEYRKWIHPRYLINGRWEDSYHKATRVLTLNNGSTCEFMSYDQEVDKFAGTSRHFCHFDEEPPKSIFSECLARLIDTDGYWWMTMTPLIEFSWTADDLYEPIKDDRIPFITLFEAPTRDNIHIKSTAIDQLTFLMDEDERDARTSGSGYAESTLIYGELKNHIIPPVGLADMVGYKFFTSLDHGLRNPTAIIFGAVGPDGDIIIFREYYHTDRLVKENAVAYLKEVNELKREGVKCGINFEVDYMIGDPSTQNKDPITGTSIRQEYGEHGVWYMLGNNDVRAGIQRVKSDLAIGRLKITSDCTNLIREARTYKWKKPISSKVAARSNLLEEPVKRNDHALDALRYVIMSIPKTERESNEEIYRAVRELIPAAMTSAVYDKPIKKHLPDEGHFDEHLGYLE